MEDVALRYAIDDTTKLQFVRWDGGNLTNAAGEAKIVVKGVAAGLTDLTISQSPGAEKTSGLEHTETITVSPP